MHAHLINFSCVADFHAKTSDFFFLCSVCLHLNSVCGGSTFLFWMCNVEEAKSVQWAPIHSFHTSFLFSLDKQFFFMCWERISPLPMMSWTPAQFLLCCGTSYKPSTTASATHWMLHSGSQLLFFTRPNMKNKRKVLSQLMIHTGF